ncbi:MAG: hypothetical protein HYS73_01335 [Parcubacteria group bacterium]|nr:hypothetical protein [Parcubacteria group bacterium]
MSETSAGVFNTSLADQLKGLNGGTPEKKPKKPEFKKVQRAPVPTAPPSREPIAPPQRSADGAKKIGETLDRAREWVSDCAMELVSLWGEAAKSDAGSTEHVILEEQAHGLVKNFVSFLEGGEKGAVVSADEQARLARWSAIFYAAVIMNTADIPSAEIHRALWFLLKTDAVRVCHEPPQGAESIRVLPKIWIEFPHAFLGAPTTDGRALEESGLLGASGAIADFIKKDSDGFWQCIADARKGATAPAFPKFYDAPCAGTFVLPIPSVYLEESKTYYGGGSLVVKSEGNADSGFYLSVIQFVDDRILTFYEGAIAKKAVLQTKFVPLSSSFRAFSHGERFSSIKLPLEAFGKEHLYERRVDIGHFEGDPDKFRAMCHIASLLKRAIRMSLRPSFANPRKTEKPAVKAEKTASPMKLDATRGKERHAAERRSDEKKETISSEELSQAAAALKKVSDEKILPAISQAEFFAPAQPAGCTHATLASQVRGRSGVHFVAFRSVAREKASVYFFPKRLENLFSGGKYAGLVFSLVVKQTMFEYHKSRAPILPVPKTRVAEAEETKPVSPPSAPEAEAADVPQTEVSPISAPPVAAEANVWASPRAKALAEELGIGDEKITSHGKKVTKADVEAYAKKKAAVG